MNKVCVFITGTNAVGKSTLAKELIRQYGGISHSDKTLTLCGDGRVCFAGRYDLNRQYGGVDGFNQTKCLESVVRQGLRRSDVIICEGMYLHTFGMNLTNAAFVADRQLLIFLYTPVKEIHRRLLERSGKGLSNEAVWRKQLNCATAARKWASIGVPVLSFDTSQVPVSDISQNVMAKIDELCAK